MTALWKTRTRDRLLVVTLVMILVTSAWTLEPRKIRPEVESNELEIEVESSLDADSLEYYLTHWNASEDDHQQDDSVYYGEGLPEVFFHASSGNSSLVLRDLSRCLYDFRFVTCLKFLLLNRLNDAISYLEENNLTRSDFSFMNGVVSFRRVDRGEEVEEAEKEGVFGLDEDINRKVHQLFRHRTLELNLVPGVAVDVIPQTGTGFVGLKARPHFSWNFWNRDEAEESVGRGKRKGFKMPSMMMMPQLIMFGMMPFMLANVQAMVMNAFMMNMMALNSAIFMTIRNLVFGPRGGPKVKYVNYGYKRKSSVPTVIVHSPAAFVKQPFRKFKKRIPFRPHPPPEPPKPYAEHIHSAEFSGPGSGPDSHIFPHTDKRRHSQGIRVTRAGHNSDGANRLLIRVRSNEEIGVREILRRMNIIEGRPRPLVQKRVMPVERHNFEEPKEGHWSRDSEEDRTSHRSEESKIRLDHTGFKPMLGSDT